ARTRWPVCRRGADRSSAQRRAASRGLARGRRGTELSRRSACALMRLSLNGLEFNVEIEGRGSSLLVLHGFTGSVSAWAEVRPALAAFARAIVVDALGHGRPAAPAAPARHIQAWRTRDRA